jgi:phage terminase small subunit
MKYQHPRPNTTRAKTFKAQVASGDAEGAIERLGERQKAFVQEYFVDFNGAAAVQRAGYTTKHPAKIAYQLLSHPGVKALINKEAIRRQEEILIKPEYVINKVVRTIETAEQSGNHSAVLKGCELLARHLGMFIERTEISGPNGDPIRYEQVKEAADAFTSAIHSLIERAGEDEPIIIIDTGDKS